MIVKLTHHGKFVLLFPIADGKSNNFKPQWPLSWKVHITFCHASVQFDGIIKFSREIKVFLFTI